MATFPVRLQGINPLWPSQLLLNHFVPLLVGVWWRMCYALSSLTVKGGKNYLIFIFIFYKFI